MAGKGQGEHSAENGKKGGRPKSSSTLRAQLFREKLSERMEEKVDRYFEAWEDLALGHFVEVRDADGNTTKVYKRSPDGKAIKDVMDQAMGKAPQKLDLSTNGKDLPTPILPLNAISGNDSNTEDQEAEQED